MGRIAVSGLFLPVPFNAQRLALGILYGSLQGRFSHDAVPGEVGQVGHEVGVDHRPVLVADGSVRNDAGKAGEVGREQREVRGEEEEAYALRRVPPLYFCKD